MNWTFEKLKACSPESRWTIYANAMRIGSPEAMKLMALIDGSGLAMSKGGGLPAEHPTIVAIRDVAMSPDGVRAGVEAIKSGYPAMAGVDPLLQERVSGHQRQSEGDE